MSGQLNIRSTAHLEQQAVAPDQYRAGAVAGLCSYSVPTPSITRRVHYNAGVSTVESGAGSADKLESFYHHRIPRDVALTSLRAGTIKHDVVTFDVSERGPTQPLTNQIVNVTYKQQYNFIDVGVSAAIVRTELQFFPVRPPVDNTKLNLLKNALTVHEVVKPLKLQLPKLVAQSHASPGAQLYSDFEPLRRAIANQAINDDYGMRLSHMARIVLHSFTAQAAGLSHAASDVVSTVDVRTMFVAETYQMSAAELQQRAFVYVDDDISEEYWAFLAMAMLGINTNVGNTRTVYSRLVSVSELRGGQQLYYVMKSGENTPANISQNACASVLNNPEKCLSFYNAYAQSLGLAQEASSVLRQVAVMPFMFTKNATLPYKARENPKADAYVYLLRETAEDIRLMYNSVETLVYQAPIIAGAVKAGVAAISMSYRVKNSLNVPSILAAIKEILADPSSCRSTMSAVLCSYGGITADLEWLLPFTEGVDIAMDACVRAYRDCGWLITTYNDLSCLGAYAPAFSTGVDMRNAQFGYDVASRPYLESLIALSTQGLPWTFENESLDGPTLQRAARDVVHWEAVIQWDAYSPGEGVSVAHITPTPVSPKQARPFETEPNAHLSERWQKSKRTLSGNGLKALTLSPPSAAARSEATKTASVAETLRTHTRSMSVKPNPAPGTKPHNMPWPVQAAASVPSGEVSDSESTTTRVTRANSVASTDDTASAATVVQTAPPGVTSPPRGRSVTPIGTTVDLSREPTPSLAERLKSPFRHQRVRSRSVSSSRGRATSDTNMGQMLDRGASESSEIALIRKTKPKDVAELGEHIVTSDGRIELITQLAGKRDYSDVVRDLLPGGVGTPDVGDWTGTSKNGEQRNITTLMNVNK
ncbi:hypothetical protein [Fusarium graminearum mycovirus China 9]|uniref:Uncharacterized protein n=1 Tax=Fusarium graminearum mycovirus China 9 TaxID=941336 RepID=E7DDJ1_9VIRU|nr:hypothetical protein [Fusarium graminearum mycovirus China 9]